MTELIKAASIARVTSKAGKFLGFLVKSNHTEDYYQVTCLKIDGKCEFFCNCKAGQFGKVVCCHVKAVKELVAARKEQAQQPAPVATVEEAPAEQTQTGKFHANMFVGSHGCSVYVSNEEMDALKARVAARKAAKQEDEASFPKAKSASCKRAKQFEDMPLNGNQGFSLLKPAC